MPLATELAMPVALSLTTILSKILTLTIAKGQPFAITLAMPIRLQAMAMTFNISLFLAMTL
jgi:hypothetical protein